MVMLVTLQQASDHLRRDTTDDNADLELKIMAASSAIIDYISDIDFLDSSGEVPTDSNGELIGVPKPLQFATIALVQVMYQDPTVQSYIDGDSQDRLGKTTLPRLVHWLLEPYRKPRIA